MVAKNDTVRDFLATRRAKITPEMAGLTVSGIGGRRRVPGLRREEVALIAGISVDYYTRLEKGNLSGTSDEVLDAVALALQLDGDERAYLFDLARTANSRGRPPRGAPRRRAGSRLRPEVQHIVDAMTTLPVIVHDARLDVIGANLLGRALFAPIFDSPTHSSAATRPNLARFVFLDPGADQFYPQLDQVAPSCVELLRMQAGRDPYDKALSDLVGELSTRSEEFRSRWATHDVQAHRGGMKDIHHPAVGDLVLVFEALRVARDEDLTLSTYVAEPGSPSAERLQLLATLAATEPTAR